MRTGWTSQSQAVQFKDALEMGKQHFYFFAFAAGLLILGRVDQAPNQVPCIFMDAARNLAKRRVRTALRLEVA